MLTTKKVTLVNPGLWQDTNDTYYLERYRTEKKLGSLLALCCTTAPESYHLWNVFAYGPGGVRIEFREREFKKSLALIGVVRQKDVVYKKFSDIKGNEFEFDEMPFVKRWPYRDESEYRFIYESDEVGLESKSFDLGVDAIQRVVLSPWVPESIADATKNAIKSVPDCENLTVTRTTVLDNPHWKGFSDRYK
jgi:hypothetical protein